MQQLVVTLTLHLGLLVSVAVQTGAAAVADVQRLLSWLVVVPAQQQLAASVALHRGVNVSAGVQVAAWTGG
jgi:hypothetical protein